MSEQQQRDIDIRRYLTFILNGNEYAVELTHVGEIVGMQQMVEIPGAPSYSKGVINLRGMVVPTVDVRLRLSMEPAAYNQRTSIIVVRIYEASIGLVVDEVKNVSDFDYALMRKVTESYGGIDQAFLEGIYEQNGNTTCCLNVEHLVMEMKR